MKPLSHYHVQRSNKGDGRRGVCKLCRKADSVLERPRHTELQRQRYHADLAYRARFNEYRKRYNGNARERQARKSRELSDEVVIASIKRGTDLKTADIRPLPEFIATWRQLMKTKRLLREKKHGQKEENRSPETIP